MNTTVTTRTLLSGLVAAACASGAASADFVGAQVEDVSGLVQTPPGLTTYRVFIEFSNPADQLLAISGNQDVGGFSFSTDAPDGLVNAGGVFSGFKQEDFTWFPAVGAPWDSWVTIGASTFAGNDTDYSPGFLGSDGVHNIIKGTEFSQASNGGWFDSDPDTPANGGSILIAQFTIAEGYEFVLEGTVDYYPGGNPPSSSEYFSVDSANPCVTTHTLISTCPPTDIDGSGATGFADLMAVLAAWGPCSPDFELTAQNRWTRISGRSCNEECAECYCYVHSVAALGYGRFDPPQSVNSTIRDHGFEAGGWHYGSCWCTGGAGYSESSGVGLEFVVNVPLPFAFVAEVDDVLGGWGFIRLSGPGGFQLNDPVEAEGTLAPGSYVLISEAVADGECGGDDGEVHFAYELDLEGTRCASDIDRNGVVDWRDLLRVLASWGPCAGSGACCLPDGSCTEVLGYEDCIDAGGVHAGWGTWCETFACPSFVACCLPDGTCADLLEGHCLPTGGIPQGPNSTCAGVGCPGFGACCLPMGTCVQSEAGGAACAAQGGVYSGDDTLCADITCPQPGACCLLDGTCTQSAVGGGACAAAGGVYHGDGTFCANVYCPSGACCMPDGFCVQSAIGGGACAAAGGVYQGDDTLCADVTCPQPGACCLPDGTCIQSDIGGSACAIQGGVYHGDETLCADVLCPQPGACCLPSGACIQSDVGGQACAIQGGVYHGDESLCADVLCPQPGACCLPTGTCLQAPVGGDHCAFWGGVYHGDDTLCADVVCPQPGACCLPDGMCVQSDVGGDDCTTQGGIYHGDGTLCADVVCAQPGACCFPDWTCSIETEELCDSAGGTFAGEETSCAVVNCSQGACCLPDGSCVVLTPASCDAVGGTYQGGGIACETVSCP